MKETIYKCDRCVKQVLIIGTLSYKLLVRYKKIKLFGNYHGKENSYYEEDSFDLCKDCYNKLVKFMKEVQEDE